MNPDVALSRVGPSDLSATDPITSVGFFAISISAIARWDEVAIDVPEPSALLLSALGLLPLLRRKR